MLKLSINSTELEIKIKEIEENADKIASEVVQQVGSLIKTNARHYVPVDTGALKASIALDVNGNEAEVGSPLEYAPFVEYGTIYQEAKPYLSPAFNEAEAKADSIAAKVVKKYVDG